MRSDPRRFFHHKVGKIFQQRIRLKRLQRIRDVFSGLSGRVEVEGMKTWETDAFFTERSRFFLFLSKKGSRLQFVRKDRVEVVGPPQVLAHHEGDSTINLLLKQLRPLRRSASSSRYYNQPNWFGKALDAFSDPEVKKKLLEKYEVHLKKKQDEQRYRRKKWREWLRDQHRGHRKGPGRPRTKFLPKPKCPFPDLKRKQESPHVIPLDVDRLLKLPPESSNEKTP